MNNYQRDLNKLEWATGKKKHAYTFPNAKAANQADSTATAVAALKTDFNALLLKLKKAGLMVGDDWPTASALKAPTPSAMPTEETKDNSSTNLTSVALSAGVLTITLAGKVSDLEDADHGASWGEHKWLGFGVRTGFASIVGLKFTDDTGASCTLASADATEATALGLSAGDFILYIKAEDPDYLFGRKGFTLEKEGYEPVKVRMKIVETTT